MQGVDGFLDMEFAVPGGDGKLLSRIWVLCSRGWAESVREVQGVDGILDMEFLIPRGMGSCCQGDSHPGDDNFGMWSSWQTVCHDTFPIISTTHLCPADFSSNCMDLEMH